MKPSECDYCGSDAATCGGQLCVSPGCLEPMLCSDRCQRDACPEEGMCRMHPECCEHANAEHAHRDDEREYAAMQVNEMRAMNRERTE